MARGIAQIAASVSSNIVYPWKLSSAVASPKTAAVLFADGNLPPCVKYAPMYISAMSDVLTWP